jgi:predicted Zn-dependent protease
MERLPPPDCHHLRAAQGWLELGNPREATAELSRLTLEFHSHPEVLDVRWHIQAHAKQWEACVDLAKTSIQLDPDRPEAWIHCAFALHELKRTQEAFDGLRSAAHRFPTVWTIPYNLACYCAQLGRLDESRSWLRKAMALDAETVKRAAAADSDLAPLRNKGS